MTTAIIATSSPVQVSTENVSECIKGQYKFTETVYHNVCNDTVHAVPNGFWDYTVGIVLFLLALAVLTKIMD